MTDQPPSVGIIIPTYGQWEYAKLAVESASRTPGAVVIIVDDGSPTWPGERVVSGWVGDGAPFAIQRYFGNRRNLSRSWNTGIEIARGMGCPYVVCGNSDLSFPRAMVGTMRAAIDEGADFVGPITNAPGPCEPRTFRDTCRATNSLTIPTTSRRPRKSFSRPISNPSRLASLTASASRGRSISSRG